MKIPTYQKFLAIIIGIGLFSFVISINDSFLTPITAQMNMGHDGKQSNQEGKSQSGMMNMVTMMGGSGHGSKIPGMVQQVCHSGNGMVPHYCEPTYKVMSSVKGLKILDVDPISDNQLQVVVSYFNNISNTLANNPNIVVVGGGGDLAGSTIISVEPSSNQKITAELNLVGGGSIYNIEKIHVHLFLLTS